MAKPRRRRRPSAPPGRSELVDSHLSQARRARVAMPQNPPAGRRSSLETAAAAALGEHHPRATAGPLQEKTRPAPAAPSLVAGLVAQVEAAAGPAPAPAAPAAAAPPLSYRRGPAAGPCPSNRARNRALAYPSRGPRPALKFRRRLRSILSGRGASSLRGGDCSSFVKAQSVEMWAALVVCRNTCARVLVRASSLIAIRTPNPAEHTRYHRSTP